MKASFHMDLREMQVNRRLSFQTAFNFAVHQGSPDLLWRVTVGVIIPSTLQKPFGNPCPPEIEYHTKTHLSEDGLS